MTFNYTTLITDRTQSDVDRVKYLAQRITKGTATDAERAEYLTDLKGAYNASDLNRVTAAMLYLKRLYDHYGYHVNYTPIYIERKKKSRLPAGYTEVAYIQSSGTQWVNSDVVSTISTKISLDFSVVTSGSDDVICGVISPNICIGYSETAIKGSFKHGVGWSTEVPSNVVGRHTASIENGIFTLDGTTQTFTGLSSYSTAQKIYLFAAAYSQGSDGTYGKVSAKVYSAKIYDNGTLVRDFVPCINADNAVGLYDLVNGQFYGNSGTGTFTAGDVVESASESDTLDPYTWYVSDIPTQAQMQTYLQNVVVLKNKTHEILSYYDAESQYPLPDAPADMVKLTYQEANDIEQILQSIENQLIYMSNHFYWYYSGEVYAGEI